MTFALQNMCVFVATFKNIDFDVSLRTHKWVKRYKYYKIELNWLCIKYKNKQMFSRVERKNKERK